MKHGIWVHFRIETRQRMYQKFQIKFPAFIDLELFWHGRGILEFQVHQKNNQLLKCTNKDTTHVADTFKEIPSGVLNR